jgi:hypothetical protein
MVQSVVKFDRPHGAFVCAKGAAGSAAGGPPMAMAAPADGAARRVIAALRGWLTEWAGAFAEARAYGELRRRLQDYDDHLLIDVGLRRVGDHIEVLPGGVFAAARDASGGGAEWPKS